MSQTESPSAPPDDSVPETVTRPLATKRPKTVACALTFAGVVLPLICFAISFPDRPNWQSGVVSDYAQLLLSHKCSLPLYPVLLYCMTCMVLVVWQPGRFSGKFWVRWGIYFGVLVAAEFWLVFQAAMPDTANHFVWPLILSPLAVLVPWAGWRIAVFFYRRGVPWGVLIAGAFVILMMACVALTGWQNSIPREILASAILICLWCSTPWAVGAYASVSIELVRGREAARLRFSLAQLFGLVSVFAAHLGAWKLSFVWMLEEYAQLPTTAPNGCFVCTAAANGHASIVQSEAWSTPGRAACRVNDQLRTLKAFELLIASISPSMHRRCRWAYDRVGPRAAALLCHPLLADIGYFLLKPAEWCARVCLFVVIPGQMGLVHRLYRDPSDRQADG